MNRPRGRLRRGATIIVIALGAFGTTGCAARPVPPPIHSKAPVGSIIVYRNGVAYFERYLPPGEKELTLRVPIERVDDFLKSLTILDDETGETMPVSYPTLDPEDGEVAMTIELPPKHNGLRISYVTESPAWKPSYRLVLGDDGNATLQGWAVVDNVSGEDWKHVKIGVGSTSALSFRYDLHSVHLVERETLSSGSLVAAAPPTGGSPYAQTGKKRRIVADLRQSEIGDLSEATASGDANTADEAQGQELAGLDGTLAGSSFGGGGRSAGRAGLEPATRAEQTVVALARRLQSSGEKIRIEGFARPDDDDPRKDSLYRANIFRNKLLENGVDPSQVDAIGTGAIDADQGLRVVALEGEDDDKKGVKGEPSTTPEEGEPQGRAHFVSSEPMTIGKDHSAMVSILNAKATAEKVYFYDPISDRGSKDFAFNAVKLRNPSAYMLDSGPFTVYAEGQFLGEGLTEPILPKATAFIPYALDRSVLVEPEITGREEISRLVTIQRGIVHTESKQVRKTKLAITNRGQNEAVIYVRHRVAPDHRLSTLGPEVRAPEKLDGAHLFRVSAPAGETVELVIEEWTPVERTVDLASDGGIEAIGLYLKTATLDPELKEQLQAIVARHTSRANLAERIQTLSEQIGVYRTRVDELNVQLVTLRKLPRGAKLRRHLSGKMEEISDRLQEATMKLADMRAELMTERIELQDALAELTLKNSDPDDLAAEELASKE
ncbi:MAG TPA: hypothetical protein ENK57_15305 [Polyangiaceae bacterium]|nr:hypothetical protein [Polyangiaceae bacterium]